MKSKTIIIPLFIFLLNSFSTANPDFNSVDKSESIGLTVTCATPAFPVNTDQDVFLSKEVKHNFIELKPSAGVIKWVIASAYKSVKLVKISPDATNQLSKWFAAAEWKEGPILGDDGPIGLAPTRVGVFKDQDEYTLFWQVSLYDEGFGVLSPAISCTDGIWQARPDAKHIFLDKTTATLLWKILE